jgi:hypothetical protein
MAPGGAVESVDLASGKALWTAPGAGKPLAAVGRRLLVQRDGKPGEGLPLAVLDAEDGGRVLGEAALPLPEGVAARIDQASEGTIDVSAQAEGAVVWLRWVFRPQPTLGMLRPPENAESPTGAVRVDLDGPSFEPVPFASVPAPARAALPAAVEASRGSGRWLGGPWDGGSVLAAPVRAPEGGESYEVLRWSRAGEPLPPVRLEPGFAPRLASADERHLLATKAAGIEGGLPRWSWRVVDLASGETLHRGDHDAGAAPFVLAEGRLLFVAQPYAVRAGDGWTREPLRLRALVASSGADAWSRPLRDVRAGPRAPPAR